MDTINGLPSHPLFIHAPVVLLPLAAVVAVGLAARPRWRRAWSVHLAVVALAILVATQLAVTSGEALAELAGDAIDIRRHRSLGRTTRNLIVGFVGLSAVVAVLDRRAGDRGGGDRRNDGAGERMPIVAAVLASAGAAVAVAATVWLYRTGDEGARLVWEPVIQAGQR